MSKYHRVVGIDLGTTYSVVAVYNTERRDVVVIPNPKSHNERTTPSVVYVSPQGDVSVGRAAKGKLDTDAKSVIVEVKRSMGEQLPGGGKKMVSAAGRELEPEVVSAHILRALKLAAESFLGGELIHDAVITVPAYFKEPQKKATEEAARIAGLNVRMLVNEPTAAAIAYAAEAEDIQTFLVYDFGGGTFDVSVVRMDTPHSGEVVGTGGDSHLGGGDIDKKIMDWALAKMSAEHGRDFSSDAKLLGRLRTVAERTKIGLCALDDANGSFDFELPFPAADIPSISYSLSNAEFERMIQPLLLRTLEQVDVALESAKSRKEVTRDDISAIILVGGSSKVPAVRRLLSERYGKPLKTDLNADEIVAMGAAYVGSDYGPSLGVELADDAQLRIDPQAAQTERLESTSFRDVVSHTLGIGLKDDVYDALVPKDEFIPCKVVRDGYTTAHDNQTSIFVPIFQGDNPKASANQQIGKIVIPGLSPEPQGHHKFEITFALNESGIFDGQVKELLTNKVTKAVLDRGHGQITEKKRMDLALAVAQGRVASGPTDPIDKVIFRVHETMGGLPPAKQRELGDLLIKLAAARVQNDEQAVASIVGKITMILAQSQN